MEWWYKCAKHKITEDNIAKLQDAVKTVLREGTSLAQVRLYNDKNVFYIKTDNRISLNHFLFRNGFEEMDEDVSESGLQLLYG